ncbi:MAG: PEP-CTERM sorting domain-containing protein [Kiritimatiellae bacterium]|nr:PEP-CTERM sorting domain-containing protein [Kiritimatiellia bacterium]
MKKLMFVFAVALAAGFAQAASVVWSTGKIYAPGDDGSGYSSSLISGSGYTATIAFFTYDSVNDEYVDYAVSGTTTSSTINMNALKGSTGDDDFTTSGTYYAQLTVTKGDSTLVSSIASFEIDTSSSDPNGNLIFNTGSGFTTAGDKFPTAGWSGGSNVPEPTSGLLLVLGGAMLALRRRR